MFSGTFLGDFAVFLGDSIFLGVSFTGDCFRGESNSLVFRLLHGDSSSEYGSTVG